MNILITGVYSGIANALYKKFTFNGHNVYGIDINDPKDSNIHFYKCDITNSEELENIKNTNLTELTISR